MLAAALQPGGLGGGADGWTAHGTAIGDMDVAALEAHYAGQLSAAGWQRTDGAATDRLAWSGFRVSADGKTRGTLVVAGSGFAERHVLLVRTETEEPPFVGWRSARGA